jgi:hypothetical protein
MRGTNFIKVFLIGLLIVLVFLIAFFFTASYRAERSYERTMIELETAR